MSDQEVRTFQDFLMLSALALKNTAISNTIKELLEDYTPDQLSAVLPLLSSPLVVDCVDRKDFRALSALLGMSIYTSEDALRDCYGAEWNNAGGRVELLVDGAPVWNCPDDAFGTVRRTVATRAQQRYRDLQHLNSASASGIDCHLPLERLYNAFNRGAFEANVLAYVRARHPDYSAKYDTAVAALEGVNPPEQCDPTQRPLWGRLFNVIGDLFTLWRQGNHPPVVALDNPLQPTDDNTVPLIEAIGRPGYFGRPHNGDAFEDWELSFITNAKLGGDGAKIVDIGGKTYLAIPQIFDVFTVIGSRWINITPLPELEPLHGEQQEEQDAEEEEGVDDPQLEEQRVNEARALPPAIANVPRLQAAAPPLRLPQRTCNTNRTDRWSWLRADIQQYAATVIDLNADHALRDSGRRGGPLAEGEAAYSRLSKGAQRNIVRAIPPGKNSLPQVMEAMCGNKIFRALDEREIGALLLNKLVMGQAQLPVSFGKDGEVYIDNRT